ncbi:MAG: tRNA (N(6)-L-threonylcarbamoyladenosine(37)-C(2))-methylthiotransferase [Candidatus Aenigmarchaeota archaeon]|nr:tRNA (N(6)-L-threonylcarbamoyladenosine(37)-C(2))-methylthiotransferase [Candidatus Aenigmarchaeota archaeon]
MNTVYIETYGCSSSSNDSEIMAGLLNRSGFTLVSNIELADVIIVNTCIVKSTTEHRIVSRLHDIQKKYPKKKLIVAGCMPEAEYHIAKKFAPNASMISTNYVTAIVKVVNDTINNKKIELIGKEKKDKVCLPKIRRNPAVDIVELCSGCHNNCSYCITKLAKGSLFSYQPDKIVQEIKSMHAAGVKEFWLTGQDIASYDYEGICLPELIKKITEAVKGKYFLRLGMMNPASVLPILDALINAYRNKHIFKFLHIPVQSGSDKILKAMNRNYTINEFKQITSAFRKEIPEITIWTDIIVGFPGESDDDFLASVSLLKEIKPDFTNISQFGTRPGTKAASMKQLPTEKKKERSRIMTKLIDVICLEQNKRWLNWSGPAIVDEYNRENQNWVARNHAYKPIAIKEKSAKLELGQLIDVKITGAEKTHLVGSIS